MKIGSNFVASNWSGKHTKFGDSPICLEWESMTQAVRDYLRRVGLDAWAMHFQTHLPENSTSVTLVRATTAADLRRMGTKAKMRLDHETIQQVLNALSKK
jgi:hypothetical protein